MIKRIMNVGIVFATGVVAGIMIFKQLKKTAEKNEADKNEIKKERYAKIIEQWLLIKELNQGIEHYFEKNGLKRIAVYGYGPLGKHFVRDLNSSGISVEYIVDRSANVRTGDIPVYSPEDNLPDADIIVVTPILDMQDVKEKMEKKVNCPVVTLEEVIYECL